MGLFSRVIKAAGGVDEDGDVVGGTVDEQEGRPTMHGRPSQWELRAAQGNLARMNEKPKPVPWSKDVRRP